MIPAAPVSTAAPRCVPLPPSGRDFEVYRRTAVEGRTTREVAAEFELSQTRVTQLRNKVFEWIGAHLPPPGRMSDEQRLRAAETLAFEQLQQQYAEAMEAWRNSATAVHVTRYVGRAIDEGVTQVKESHGDPKYLKLATHISKASARQKLALMPDPETATWMVGEETASTQRTAECADDPAVVEPEHAALVEAADHPKGDCSAVAVQAMNRERVALMAASEIRDGATLCGVGTERKSQLAGSDSTAIETVQTVLEELENVPQRIRKQRRREQHIRRELFGKGGRLTIETFLAK